MSHSGSTPSQSEEEEEVSGNSKGEGPSCQTTQRPSVNKGFRTSQTELSPPVSSPQAPHLHPQCEDRHLPSKGVRTTLRPSLHKCHRSNTKEANLLPPLKNIVEEGTKNSQIRDHAIETSVLAQHSKLNVTPKRTENHNLTRNLTSQGGNGSQERKAKSQEEIPKATEHDSHATVGQVFNRTHLVRSNLHSADNKRGKQDSIQQGVVKGLKKGQTVRKDAPKGMDKRQDVNKTLLMGHTVGQSAQKLTLNGHGGFSVDCAEAIRGQPQILDNKGPEDNPNKAELSCQDKEMTSHQDRHMEQDSQEPIKLECGKEDGCQRRVVNDQYQSQSIQKGRTCKFPVTATQIGNVNPCDQMAKEGSPTPTTSGSGNEPSVQIAKAVHQKKSLVDWKQTKVIRMKDNSPTKLSAGKLPLQEQLKFATENGQPLPEAGQEVALKTYAEPSRGSGLQLTSTSPSGMGVLKCKLPGIDLERMPCSTFSVLDSPSSSVQTGLKTSQKPHQLLKDQCTVTPFMEDTLDDKQTLNPTLTPSNVVMRMEATGGSCGPTRHHTPGPTSPSVGPASTQSIPRRASSSHDTDEPNQESESRGLHPSKFHSPESDIKILSSVEDASVLGKVPVANVRILDVTEASMEDTFNQSAKEEEEDKELASFSSLLASKLSLSPYNNHRLLPIAQGGPQPSLPTDTWQQGAKTMPSTREEMPQDTTALPSKNWEPKPPPQHCCHKRKFPSSGTRKSKRLRNQ